jgi:hypothetical protein
MIDEPTIPALITVGNGRFHAGVKVSTVQGAIDRLAARLTVSPLPDAKELCHWILGFLENECSLDPSCVSAADRSNIENAIANGCGGSSENCELCDGLEKHIADLESRLASPLPKEIAGLINAMRKRYDDVLAEPVAAALQAQARDIESLKEERDTIATDLVDGWQARIAELEAERGRLQAELRVCYKLPLTMGHPIAQKLAAERDAIEAELRKIACFIEPHWQGAGAKLQAEWMIRAIGRLNSERDELEAERDAIEAAMIERILALIPGGTHCDPQEIADSIRALAKPSAETE